MIIGVLYSLLSCNPAPGPHWARQPIRTRRALLVPPLVGPSHRDGNLLKRPSPRLRNATGFTSTSMRRAPRRMRQEFWRARAFPMISKRYRLVASLPHPRTGGSLPTLRFRFFRKRVRHVPQPADGAPGRPLRPRYETSVSAHSRGPHFWVSSDLAKTPRQLPRRRRPGVNFKFKFQVELVKFRFTSRSCASPVARSRGSPAARGHFPLVPSPRISY